VNRHDPLGLWWWDGGNIEYGILPLFGFTKGGQTVGDAWGALGEGYHQGAVNVVTAPYRLGNYAGEQGIAAYDLGKETGSSDFEALRLATGVTVTRVTGALDLIEATVGGQKIVGDSDSGLGMQDFSSGWERTLHGVAGGLQLVGTATTFAGSVTRFSSAPRVPGSPPINAVNPELANRLAVSNAAKTGPFNPTVSTSPTPHLSPTAAPQRIQGPWTQREIARAQNGQGPLDFVRTTNRAGREVPLELHHADQMPGSAIHEVAPFHSNIPGAHPNKFNQGVTPTMRAEDAQFHWYFRVQEMGY